mgnify:CR=1 FL=1|tara:strand:- start:711 stop:2168 length:1458 start_codon:yes stop_codon:yes gene_type:complete
MSDTTTTSTDQSVEFKYIDNKEKTSFKFTSKIGNQYIHDGNGNIKTVNVVKFDANGENPVVIGEIRNSIFIHNNAANDIYVDEGKKLSFAKLDKANQVALIKASKNISSKPSTLDDLNLSKNKEKKDKFLKEKFRANEASLQEVDESIDARDKKIYKDTMDANAAKNLEALKKRQFRKQYGNFFYPLGIKNNNQDRIKITVVDFKPQGGITLAKEGEKKEPIDFELKRSGEKVIRGSATLPIPNGVSDQNRVDFTNGTLNPAQAVGAQIALNTLLGGIGEGGQALGDSVTGVLKDPNTPKTIANLLTSFALGIQPDQLVARTQGAVFNNNLALLFKGPTLRPFNFNFNVSPRDLDESREVQKIIRMFKQSSAVQRTENGLFLGSPHVYDIEFLSGSSSHKFLPRIKTCALEVFAVNYMPNNTYMTYENSSMVSYNLQFQFKEIDPIFNDDYDELDFTDFDEPKISDDGGSIAFFEQKADSGGIGF